MTTISIPAIIPAAGLSRRMGRPKLILPILGTKLTVIESVVQAFRDGGCDPVMVVAPPIERSESAEVVRLAALAGAKVLVPPDQPPDMRASLLFGLRELERQGIPKFALIAPGDAIGMTADAVARCVRAAIAEPDRLIVPVHQGRRGHPLVLPWRLVEEIRALPADLGVNAVVRRHEDEIRFEPIDDPMILEDLDAPADYERWRSARSRPQA